MCNHEIILCGEEQTGQVSQGKKFDSRPVFFGGRFLIDPCQNNVPTRGIHPDIVQSARGRAEIAVPRRKETGFRAITVLKFLSISFKMFLQYDNLFGQKL